MKPVEAAPELRAFLRRSENRAFLEFYEYWRRKAAGKGVPSRADIDPVEIAQLLRNVFLVDIVPGPPRRFRFRLVGTRIAEMEGEMTNRFLDEIVPSPSSTAMARQYEEAAEGRISVRHETLRWHTRDRHIDYDVLLLPLSRDGKTIDMLFGLCVYHIV